jgi:hypothetical protein
VFVFLFFIGIILDPGARRGLFLAFGLICGPKFIVPIRHFRRNPRAAARGFSQIVP